MLAMPCLQGGSSHACARARVVVVCANYPLSLSLLRGERRDAAASTGGMVLFIEISASCFARRAPRCCFSGAHSIRLPIPGEVCPPEVVLKTPALQLILTKKTLSLGGLQIYMCADTAIFTIYSKDPNAHHRAATYQNSHANSGVFRGQITPESRGVGAHAQRACFSTLLGSLPLLRRVIIEIGVRSWIFRGGQLSRDREIKKKKKEVCGWLAMAREETSPPLGPASPLYVHTYMCEAC